MERIWMKKPNRFFITAHVKVNNYTTMLETMQAKGFLFFIFWSCIKLQLFWDNILLIFEHVFVYS